MSTPASMCSKCHKRERVFLGALCDTCLDDARRRGRRRSGRKAMERLKVKRDVWTFSRLPKQGGAS